MKKFFAKHPNLRLLLLALIASGLFAFALAIRAAQSNVSFYDVFLPKKKTVTTTENTNQTPSPTTTPTPQPSSKTTSEGKSLGDTSAQAPTSSGLSVMLIRYSAVNGIAAKTNLSTTGTCTFTFSNGSTETVDLINTSPSYSGCQVSGEGRSGLTVKVSVSTDSGSATSESMKVE